MKLAAGSDERTHLTDFVVEELRRRGHDVELFGPLAGEPLLWPEVARRVAERVASGKVQEGVLFCWTGTGVCIAANKVPGIRAALCADAETARGARKWDHANVLALSLRLTPEAVSGEILDAWFSTPFSEEELPTVALVSAIERKYKGG
ncbi:MAG TPA: RpiB/LacA/LacB family sugar-phosphate isomerase [Dehalococcoidia bacterium]|nr:RpiB/LacA/LacB family sugar-phosphate isomerase [Dehalococcoidia bacterium]